MIYYNFLIETAIFLIFAVPLSVADVRTFRIPLAPLFAGIAAFLALRLFFPPGNYVYKIEILASSVISSFIVLAATRVLSGGGLGKGDIFFGIFASLYCSWWKNLAGLLFAALLGILAFLFLSVLDKARKDKRILHPFFAVPFVPFISAGAVLSRLFFG